MQKQILLKVFRQNFATPCTKAISCQVASARFCGGCCQITHAPFGVAGKPDFDNDFGAIRFNNSVQNNAPAPLPPC